MSLKKRFDDRIKPIDKKYSITSIGEIIGHPDYIGLCAGSSEIQEYWRKPEYLVNVDGVLVLSSNINPGDFFNHGDRGVRQIGIVSKKITLCGKPRVDGLRDSTHPIDESYLKYECCGENGGFQQELWHDHGFDSLASGYFVWLPLSIQLHLAGFPDQANELDKLTKNICTSSES